MCRYVFYATVECSYVRYRLSMSFYKILTPNFTMLLRLIYSESRSGYTYLKDAYNFTFSYHIYIPMLPESAGY